MSWTSEHVPHIAGGIAGSGGLLVIIFKDGIRDIIADWKKEREAMRAERATERALRTNEHGKGDAIAAQLVGVLRDDLKERRDHDIKHDDKITAVLEGVKEMLGTLKNKQDEQGKQLDIVHQRIINIQGAVGRVQ